MSLIFYQIQGCFYRVRLLSLLLSVLVLGLPASSWANSQNGDEFPGQRRGAGTHMQQL
jgi:hypothetical protein